MKRCVIVAAFLLAWLPASKAQEKEALKLSEGEQKLLDLINQVRQKKDLPLLRPDPVLFKVARAQSANMARNFKMEHDIEGKTPFDRLKIAGYTYALAAE